MRQTSGVSGFSSRRAKPKHQLHQAPLLFQKRVNSFTARVCRLWKGTCFVAARRRPQLTRSLASRLRRALDKMGAHQKNIVWTSMREEPVICAFVRNDRSAVTLTSSADVSGGRPHVLRLFDAPLENVSLARRCLRPAELKFRCSGRHYRCHVRDRRGDGAGAEERSFD